MPIRMSATEPHPTLNISSITQVIEWGSLATVVAVDSRLTDRSKEATLYDTLTPFEELLVNDTDIDAYYNESSPTRQKIDRAAEIVMADLKNPNRTMIGTGLRNLVRILFNLTSRSLVGKILPSLINLISKSDHGHVSKFEASREALANLCPTSSYGESVPTKLSQNGGLCF